MQKAGDARLRLAAGERKEEAKRRGATAFNSPEGGLPTLSSRRRSEPRQAAAQTEEPQIVSANGYASAGAVKREPPFTLRRCLISGVMLHFDLGTLLHGTPDPIVG